ncbi:MAG: hydrogenase maturation protease [Spirochaetes bacterium]|nr:hydrogenase maturation protease [Spirochaetota bacterium]
MNGEMAEYTAPVLVVGVGNILMKDEGVGVRVIEELANQYEFPKEVELLDGGTSGFGLLSFLKARKKVIIVDALKIGDRPGSVYRCKIDELIEKPRGFSLHEVGILDVFRTLRMLGEDTDVEIVGIVPEDIGSMEISLSESVRRAIDVAASCIIDIANEALKKIGCKLLIQKRTKQCCVVELK